MSVVSANATKRIVLVLFRHCAVSIRASCLLGEFLSPKEVVIFTKNLFFGEILFQIMENVFGEFR